MFHRYLLPPLCLRRSWPRLEPVSKRTPFRYEREDPLRAGRYRRRDRALFVDEKCNGRREHAVQLGDFPLPLQNDGERHAQLRDLARVRGVVAPADHDDVDLAAGRVASLQVRPKGVAWPAFRIGTKEENLAAAVLRQGQLPAADTR